jgi:FAD:protein FMN transferase
MGTVFSIDVRSPAVDSYVLDSAMAWLHWVDDTFSTFKADSEISRIGRDELSVGDAARDVREVLARCAALEQETGGYFSARASGRLDPSGLVKGWAIQTVSERLSAAGSSNHCVNGGGDVQCRGSSAPRQPWRVGIAHPLRRDELAGVVQGHDLAVATSGTAERGTHIFDPRSRRPADALASVTLVGRDAATVDAYATAAFAMGLAALEWIEAQPDISGLIVHRDGTVWVSPGFAATSG